ncbi:MAG TPA: ABC transporter ATP-binding protein [Enhygromyxa sp.]|nr:ABC transporter ATP-binding protein [Enhygromyxa sp.]
MAEPTIELRSLSVRRGGVFVLEDVDLRLAAGIYTLVGQNGAGKSTLLRALAGIQPPARGQVLINGHDLWTKPVAARRGLGYLPESPEFFPYLTPRELLETVNAVRGLEPSVGHEQFDHWVGGAALDRRIGTLSAGQRRKLALIAAITHEPGIVLLDEPTNTLDAAAVADLEQLLRRWGDGGRLVIIASHNPEALGVEARARLRVADRRVSLE